MKTIDELLAERNKIKLEWLEPWPACGKKGNKLDAHVAIRATVQDCINLQRETDRKNGRPIMRDDKERLLDFIVVYWAREVEEQ